MTAVEADIAVMRTGQTKVRVAQILLMAAVVLAFARPILPDVLIRVPEWAVLSTPRPLVL